MENQPKKLTKHKQYTASVKSASLDPTARALASLNDTLKADRKLTAIISAPTLTVGDKQQIVAELQKLVGGDKGEILKNFLSTLAENNRLGVLEGVCDKFGTLMGAHRGEIDLNITSAQVWSLYGLLGIVLMETRSSITRPSPVLRRLSPSRSSARARSSRLLLRYAAWFFGTWA